MNTAAANREKPSSSVAILGTLARSVVPQFVESSSSYLQRSEIRAEQSSPKAQEAKRQFERVRMVGFSTSDLDEDGKALLASSISNSVSMLGHMINGPIPIPVAGRGEEGGTTLFFDEADFYGDLEVNGSTVEYFVRLAGTEEFGAEEIVDGRVPPKLLGLLYRGFARAK
jgi:hypothetical protein